MELWERSATLDLLTYVGRRVGRLPALPVVTYRDVQDLILDRGRRRGAWRHRAMWQWIGDEGATTFSY